MPTITHASTRTRAEPSLAGWLWTNNPFYLVSAVLVLYGLFRLEQRAAPGGGRWALLGALQGYTFLVAAAAILIVRLGRVWEDARSVLLVLVLLLVASTVAADPLLESDPHLGALALGAGFVAAVLLVEGVLAGCRIRLATAFRLPLYAFLALLHGYPVLLARLLESSHEGALTNLAAALALFPWAGTLLLLSLLPAARAGREAVAGNGTPWAWPAFPWAAFAVLAACLPVRAYLAGMAYYPGRGNPVGPALLAPLGIGLAAVLVELGRRSGDRRIESAGRWIPLVSVALAFFPSSPGSWGFDQILVAHLGNPTWATAAAACAFYALRTLAGDRAAKLGLAVSIAVLSLLSPTAAGIHAPGALPLAGVTGLAVWAAVQTGRSAEATAAVAAATALLARVFGMVEGPASVERVLLAGFPLAGALAIGGLYRDEFARWVRRLSAAALAGASLYAFWRLAGPACAAAVGATLLAGIGYALWTRDRVVAACIAGQLGLLLCYAGRAAWRSAADVLERPGSVTLTAGLLAFALGAAITATKARRARRAEDALPLLEPVVEEPDPTGAP